MKKLFALMISLFVIQGTTIAMDKKISMDKLPQAAQTLIKKYFPVDKITSIWEDDDKDYTVKFKDDTNIEFDKNGVWKDVECGKDMSVPTAMLPTEIQTMLKTSHKGVALKKIEKESSGGYDLKLANGKELKLNNKFKPTLH